MERSFSKSNINILIMKKINVKTGNFIESEFSIGQKIIYKQNDKSNNYALFHSYIDKNKCKIVLIDNRLFEGVICEIYVNQIIF